LKLHANDADFWWSGPGDIVIRIVDEAAAYEAAYGDNSILSFASFLPNFEIAVIYTAADFSRSRSISAAIPLCFCWILRL
jgi:hypothetical protein